MKAEIIAVGTELLLGQIVNTNAQYLSQQCAAIGIGVYFQTVVGDNEARLRQAIEIAQTRADVVLFTGGLGPTQDDLTKDVLASFLNRPLLIHQPSMDRINTFFQSRGIHMVESNRRQATMIEGSDPLPNDTGLAVGNALTFDGIHYVVLPGPPREMKPMFEQYAKPWLQSLIPDVAPLHSKMLKFCGIGESKLENELIDLIEGQVDPTIAPYAKEGEVTIRLTTRAQSQEAANVKMAQTEQTIRERLGKYLYAEEDVALEKVVIDLLTAANKSLTVAESCTGGLLNDMLTSIPGCSSVFHGGIVSYSNKLKHQMLDIPFEILEGENAPGAVSEQTAQLMAEQMRTLADADYAISTTGVAGPSTSEGKPVGLVYIGIAERGKPTLVVRTQQSGNRDIIKLRTAKTALYHLWTRLIENQ